MNPSELQSVLWDYVIIGTGMGGATLGYRLVESGQRVLFLEKGEDYFNNSQAVKGDFLEAYRQRGEWKNLDELYVNSGRSSREILDVVKNTRVKPLMGIGTGGSSALYGMMLERFFPEDFEPRRYHPYAPQDNSLPERWPISFTDLEPYYRQAEKLYRVTANGSDPLRAGQIFDYLPAKSLNNKELRLYHYLEKKGMHPYYPPLALDWVDGCTFCQSYLCGRSCKNDANKICLRPAIAKGAALLTRCEVTRMEADERRVNVIHARLGSENLIFRGRTIVLAAGALETPLLLQRSSSSLWPDGIANRSGLVGRNLMRHFFEIFTLFSRTRFPKRFTLKQMSFNDFYCVDGQKFGTLGSFGHMPPIFMILDDIEQDLQGTRFPLSMFNLFRPITGGLLNFLFSRAGYLAGIVEDLPYLDNRVVWRENEQPNVAIEYRIRAEDWERIRRFRQMVRRILLPNPYLLLSQSDKNKFVQHACGTCRFGDDPKTSVLNKFNRAHDVENLYIVDSSFFPSSGGTNPGLTIAANALRVADHLLGKAKL